MQSLGHLPKQLSVGVLAILAPMFVRFLPGHLHYQQELEGVLAGSRGTQYSVRGKLSGILDRLQAEVGDLGELCRVKGSVAGGGWGNGACGCTGQLWHVVESQAGMRGVAWA